MKHDITALDLLLYLYNEVSYLEKMAIESELSRNAVLRAELDELRLAQGLLHGNNELQPPADVLQNVLAYSKASTETIS